MPRGFRGPKVMALFLVVLMGCTRLPSTSPSPLPTSTSPSPETLLPRPSSTPTSTPLPTQTPTPSPLPEPTLTPTPSEVQGRSLPPLSPGPVTLTAIRMVNERVGWAIGTQDGGETHHILRTEDGGVTWKDVTPPKVGDQGQDPGVAFWDEEKAWVAYPVFEPGRASPVVWRTQDGGRTWEVSWIPMKPDEPRFVPTPLVVANENRLWLLVHMEGGMQHDYAALFASQDGGRSWFRVTDPWEEASADLMTLYTTDMTFTPDGYGWATKSNGVAPGGIVVVTEDGGASWQGMTFVPPGMEDPFMAPPCDTVSPHLWARGVGTLLLVCYFEGESAYVIHREGDQEVQLPLPFLAKEIQFFRPQVGLAFGPHPYSEAAEKPWSVIYRTVDGGLSWEKVREVYWWGTFFFLDERRGWAIADNGQEVVLTVTQDGGATWEMLRPQIVAGP